LLQRKIAVDRLVLHGLALNLARASDGRGNWEDLLPGEERAAAAEPEPSPETGPVPAAEGIDLRIEGVELRDANVAWRDASTGQEILVRDLDLDTGVLIAGEATPLRLDFLLEPAGAPSLSVALETEATFDPAGPMARLAGLQVDVDARGDAVPGGSLSANLAADVDADLDAGRVHVGSLEVGFAGVLTARGELTALTGEATPGIEGRLALDTFNPRELMKALDMALPEGLHEDALRTASARMALSAAGDTLQVTELEIRLDDTRATGALRAAGGEIPEAELQLSADQIELDRYMPPPADDTQTAGSAATGSASEDPVASLPLESLRGVRGDAAIDVGRMSLQGLDATAVELRATLDDGLLVLERLGADLAEGSLALGARLDGRTQTPKAALDLRLDGVRSAPLLEALAGSARVSGNLDGSVELETRGATTDDWIAALNGGLVTTFSDGAIEGINVAQRLRVAMARIKGKAIDEAAQARRTDFSRLHFVASVRDGVVHSDELDLRAPLLRVGGEGRVDLPAQTIDYVARVLVTGTLKGQGGGGLAELKGLEIPLQIRGPLAGPSISLALNDALEARAKQKLEQEAREAEQKLKQEADAAVEQEKEQLERKKEKAKEKLEDELKGLFD